MYTKEDFNKVWKDSPREDILNQFYYDHIEMEKSKNIINEFEKWLEESAKCEPYIYNGILDKLKEFKGGE